MREVIVVLGAGRSGTSLAMHVLSEFGMSLSRRLISPRYHNLTGPMEDSEIADVYDRKILPAVGSTRYLPFPLERLLEDKILPNVINQLAAIVVSNIDATNSIWGFKDPFTSLLLPVWFRVFNRVKVSPKFVLCIRNPSSVVVSRSASFTPNNALNELVWLNANVQAINQVGANLFFLHYEDWFKRPISLANDLLSFVGLRLIEPSKTEERLRRIIKPNLNRSRPESYAITNPYVKELYEELIVCRGSNSDNAALLDVANSYGGMIASFNAWHNITSQLLLDQEGKGKIIEALKGKNKDLLLVCNRVKSLEQINQKYKRLTHHVDCLNRQLGHLDRI
jgi:hypothetical protein